MDDAPPPSRPLRVLYVTQYFAPEIGASPARASAIATALADRGHRVTILTEVPNHPAGVVAPEWRGALWRRRQEGPLEIIRTWVRTTPVKTSRSRIVQYATFAATATIAGWLRARGKVDVVLATSPPLPAVAAGRRLAALRGAPLVMEVRDPWPRAAVEFGALRPGWMLNAARRMETACYRKARRIVTVTDGMREHVIDRGGDPDRTVVIPNGADLDVFRFDPDARRRLRREHGWNDRFVVMYVGLHGLAQPLEVLLDAVERLRDHPSRPIAAFVGEGPRRSALMAEAERRGLGDVAVFLPERSSADLAAMLSAADVTVSPLRDIPLSTVTCPFKVYDALACERPVIAAARGISAETVVAAGGGLAVEPEDADALAAAVADLAGRGPEVRAAMGRSGRDHVTELYDLRRSGLATAGLLEEVVGER